MPEQIEEVIAERSTSEQAQGSQTSTETDQADASESSETAAVEPTPEPPKIWIRRKPGAEPITGVSVPRESHYHWAPDPEQNEFEVDEDVAIAAVATGGFTRTKQAKPASE